MKIVRCKESFRVGRGAGTGGANEGDLLPESHPTVARFPKHFEPVETYVARTHPSFVEARPASRKPVERATADPGDKRTVTPTVSDEPSSPKRGPGRPRKNSGGGNETHHP